MRVITKITGKKVKKFARYIRFETGAPEITLQINRGTPA